MSRGYRLPNAGRGDLSVGDVVEHVAFEFGLTVAAMVGPANRRYLREARSATAWLAQRHTRASTGLVAACLQRRASAVKALAAHARRLRADQPDFRLLLDGIGLSLATLRDEAAA